MKPDSLEEIYQYIEEDLQKNEVSIANDPTNVNAYMDKGANLAALQRFEEAVAVYEQALCCDTTNADVYSAKGEVLILLKRYEEAIIAFDYAILFNPNESVFYNQKGAALFSLRRYEEAIVAFDQAISLRDPGEGEVPYQNKGYALYLLENYAEALVAYDKAIEIDPLDDGPYYGKIRTLRALGCDDQVPTVFVQALRHDFHPLIKVRFLRDAGWDKTADSLEQAYKKKYPEEENERTV